MKGLPKLLLNDSGIIGDLLVTSKGVSRENIEALVFVEAIEPRDLFEKMLCPQELAEEVERIEMIEFRSKRRGLW